MTNYLEQLETIISAAVAEKPFRKTVGYGAVFEWTQDVPVSRGVAAKAIEFAQTGKVQVADGWSVDIDGQIGLLEDSVSVPVLTSKPDDSVSTTSIHFIKYPTKRLQDLCNGKEVQFGEMSVKWIDPIIALPKKHGSSEAFLPLNLKVWKRGLLNLFTRQRIEGIVIGPDYGHVQLSGITGVVAGVKLRWGK